MLVTKGEKINKANCALGKKQQTNGKSECLKQKPDKTGSTYAFPRFFKILVTKFKGKQYILVWVRERERRDFNHFS